MTVINIPIKKPPITLAIKVPSGIVGKRAFKENPNHHRNKAPAEAPRQIDKIAKGFIIEVPCGRKTTLLLCACKLPFEEASSEGEEQGSNDPQGS